MSHREPARIAAPRRRSALLAALVIVATTLAWGRREHDRWHRTGTSKVDIGPSRATAWLSTHGAEYRLCQIYRNEPWHFELRPDAVGDGCPPMYADPSHDPRMQP